MANLTLDVSDLTKTEMREPTSEKTTVTHVETVEKTPRERSPANWEVKPGSNPGTISARSRLGDRFEGTTKEFNAILRG